MNSFTDDPWTGGEQGIPQWADDDPHDLLFQPRWPESLDAAMRCQGCGAEVEWRMARQSRNVFICPECGERRWSKNAGKRLRHKTGERDGWICHRCGMPIDQSLAWPHPLSPVADHYPVSRDDGGPSILANLKIAHALCNGNTGSAAKATWDEFPPDERRMLQKIVRLPLDGNAHVRHGARFEDSV